MVLWFMLWREADSWNYIHALFRADTYKLHHHPKWLGASGMPWLASSSVKQVKHVWPPLPRNPKMFDPPISCLPPTNSLLMNGTMAPDVDLHSCWWFVTLLDYELSFKFATQSLFLSLKDHRGWHPDFASPWRGHTDFAYENPHPSFP